MSEMNALLKQAMNKTKIDAEASDLDEVIKPDANDAVGEPDSPSEDAKSGAGEQTQPLPQRPSRELTDNAKKALHNELKDSDYTKPVKVGRKKIADEKRRSARLSMKLRQSLYDHLQMIADEEDKSVSSVVESILYAHTGVKIP